MLELLKMTVAGQFTNQSGQRVNVVILRIAGDGTFQDLVAFYRGRVYSPQPRSTFLPAPYPINKESIQVSTANPGFAGPSPMADLIRLGKPRDSTPGEILF